MSNEGVNKSSPGSYGLTARCSFLQAMYTMAASPSCAPLCFDSDDSFVHGRKSASRSKFLECGIMGIEQVRKQTVTKKDLVNHISQELGIHPNEVRHIIQTFMDKMMETLAQGARLEFREFGIFEVVRRKQKVGRNPKKASVSIVIPSRNAVKFTPGKKMRKMVERELIAS